MTWTDFLETNASRYLEARQWRDAGLSWEDVLRTWHKGDDLLWAAQALGLLDDAAAARVACACVERNATLAPDVSAVTDAIWHGDAVTAWHEIMATEAITAAPEIETPGPESPMPESEQTVDPAVAKAQFSAARLLSGDYPNVLHNAVQARVSDARNALAQALRDGASIAEVRELEAAIQRVESSEHLAQADFVRWLLGGLA